MTFSFKCDGSGVELIVWIDGYPSFHYPFGELGSLAESAHDEESRARHKRSARRLAFT